MLVLLREFIRLGVWYLTKLEIADQQVRLPLCCTMNTFRGSEDNISNRYAIEWVSSAHTEDLSSSFDPLPAVTAAFYPVWSARRAVV